MGSIKNILSDQSSASENRELMDEYVSNLEEIATLRAEILKSNMEKRLGDAGKNGNQEIAIRKILAQDFQVHAVSEKRFNDSLVDTLTEVIGGFLDGVQQNVLDSAHNLLRKATADFFGGASGSIEEDTGFFVTTDGLSIVRIDYAMWRKEVKAFDFLVDTEEVAAFVWAKSTIETEEVDFETFLSAYKNFLNPSNDPAIDLEDEISRAQSLYEQFKKAQAEENTTGISLEALSPAKEVASSKMTC